MLLRFPEDREDQYLQLCGQQTAGSVHPGPALAKARSLCRSLAVCNQQGHGILAADWNEASFRSDACYSEFSSIISPQIQISHSKPYPNEYALKIKSIHAWLSLCVQDHLLRKPSFCRNVTFFQWLLALLSVDSVLSGFDHRLPTVQLVLRLIVTVRHHLIVGLGILIEGGLRIPFWDHAAAALQAFCTS